VAREIEKSIIRQLTVSGTSYWHLYDQLSVVHVSNFPVSCWFTVKILRNRQCLGSSISQKLHNDAASRLRDIRVKYTVKAPVKATVSKGTCQAEATLNSK